MAALWSLAVPASLYLTRGLGATIQQRLLQYPEPQPLDRSIDVEGALTAAEAAMHLVPLRPVSPTVAHLKALVLRGALALRTRYEASKARVEQRSLSRLFRPPCFREENLLLRQETKTLRCRVQLFLSLVSVFPAAYDDAARRGDGTASDDGADRVRRPRATASWHHQFFSAFHKTLTASQEMHDSDAAYEASSDDSGVEESSGVHPSAASQTLFNHALRHWRG